MLSNLPTTVNCIDPLLRNALDGVFVLDRNRQFILFNEACERVTGYKGADLVGKECHCCDTLDCHDEYGRPLSAALCPAKALFAGDIDSARQRMGIRRGDGSQLWVETAYSPVRTSAGEVKFVLGVMRDITEARAKEESLLEELSALRERLQQVAPWEEFDTAFEDRESLLLDSMLARVERETIRHALQAANWKRNKAARLMGISRSRLYRRMEALGIDPKEHPSSAVPPSAARFGVHPDHAERAPNTAGEGCAD